MSLSEPHTDSATTGPTPAWRWGQVTLAGMLIAAGACIPFWQTVNSTFSGRGDFHYRTGLLIRLDYSHRPIDVSHDGRQPPRPKPPIQSHHLLGLLPVLLLGLAISGIGWYGFRGGLDGDPLLRALLGHGVGWLGFCALAWPLLYLLLRDTAGWLGTIPGRGSEFADIGLASALLGFLLAYRAGRGLAGDRVSLLAGVLRFWLVPTICCLLLLIVLGGLHRPPHHLPPWGFLLVPALGYLAGLVLVTLRREIPDQRWLDRRSLALGLLSVPLALLVHWILVRHVFTGGPGYREMLGPAGGIASTLVAFLCPGLLCARLLWELHPQSPRLFGRTPTPPETPTT